MLAHPPIWKAVVIALGAITLLFVDVTAAVAAGKSGSVPEVKPPPVTPTKPAPLSDARLKAFAIASTEIVEIRKKYWPQVEAAKTEDEMKRIAAVARKKMNEAITAQGLTVDQYNGVVQAIQKDKSLIKRIERLEKEMVKTKK